MVGLPGDQSNMNPPTICIVALAIWQLALVMLARGRVSAWLARPRPWTAVIAVGSMAMTVYLWHLTAMVTVLGLVLAAHGPLPTPGGALWWATRPIWLALLAAALTPMALFLSRFEHPRRRRAPAAERPAGEAPPVPSGGERPAAGATARPGPWVLTAAGSAVLLALPCADPLTLTLHATVAVLALAIAATRRGPSGVGMLYNSLRRPSSS